MAVGRIRNGTLRMGQRITVVRAEPEAPDGSVDPDRRRHAQRVGHVADDRAGHRARGDRGGAAGRHRRGGRTARGHDRRHDHRSRRPAPAAAPVGRRADDPHDVRREHLADVGARRQAPDLAPDPRAPRARGPRQRQHRGPPDRVGRDVRGARPRRAPARGPHRADAPRGLRAPGLASRGAAPRGRRRRPRALRADHGRHPARAHRHGQHVARRPPCAGRADEHRR